MSDTLVVNLFAGAGAGKSTTAAELYVALKKMGINAELVQEAAKNHVYLKDMNFDGSYEEQCFLKDEQYEKL